MLRNQVSKAPGSGFSQSSQEADTVHPHSPLLGEHPAWRSGHKGEGCPDWTGGVRGSFLEEVAPH